MTDAVHIGHQKTLRIGFAPAPKENRHGPSKPPSRGWDVHGPVEGA